MRDIQITLLQEDLHTLLEALDCPTRLDLRQIQLCCLLAVPLQVLLGELYIEAAQLGVIRLPLLELSQTHMLKGRSLALTSGAYSRVGCEYLVLLSKHSLMNRGFLCLFALLDILFLLVKQCVFVYCCAGGSTL